MDPYGCMLDTICEWRYERVFVRRMDYDDPVYSQALLPYRMIVLEQMLPDALKDHILRQLKFRYITPFGISSEPVSSPQFEEDGY